MALRETSGANSTEAAAGEDEVTINPFTPPPNPNANAIAIAAPIATVIGLILIAAIAWFILRQRSKRLALMEAKAEQAKGVEIGDVARVRMRAGGKGREVWDEEETADNGKRNFM
ncbi:hypothetical protein ACHAQH_008902 [Verticillium albo-atrum]